MSGAFTDLWVNVYLPEVLIGQKKLVQVIDHLFRITTKKAKPIWICYKKPER
jgi:hypothetical protein